MPQDTEVITGATVRADRAPGGPAALRVALPEPSTVYEQDSEWCVVDVDGHWREIRFHDYADIFVIEGLYERLFYDVLQCGSPAVVREMLQDAMADAGVPGGDLRVLDLGAGNGIMAEELVAAGASAMVGIDILTEARMAALRDRPSVYTDYHVLDMTALDDTVREQLRGYRFTALTCVAALGFGDIPPAAFREAFNLVADGGWIAFTIKDGFVSDRDTSGFAGLVKGAISDGSLEVVATRTYRHRLSTAGEPLHYRAYVGRKGSSLTD